MIFGDLSEKREIVSFYTQQFVATTALNRAQQP
jgi:hypothetical protein